jgi:hypothetical protein
MKKRANPPEKGGPHFFAFFFRGERKILGDAGHIGFARLTPSPNS